MSCLLKAQRQSILTLGLTDQVPQGEACSLVFHLCSRVTPRCITIHLHTSLRKATRTNSRSKTPLPTFGRTSSNDWKQSPLESILLYVNVTAPPSPERHNGYPIPKVPGAGSTMESACFPTLRVYFCFNKLVCVYYFPSECLYSSTDPHVNLFRGIQELIPSFTQHRLSNQ